MVHRSLVVVAVGALLALSIPTTVGAVPGRSATARSEPSLPATTLTTTPIDLGTLGGAESTAVDVDGDIVVGTSELAPAIHHAFVYDLGSANPHMVDLGTLGGQNSSATAIDGNVVVGYADTASGAQHAFADDLAAAHPTMIDLGEGEAVDVSGNLVVGDSFPSVWVYDLGAVNPTMIHLANLGSTPCQATAVDGTTMVGYCHPGPRRTNQGHAFYARIGTGRPKMIDLGTLPGGNSSHAYDVSGNVIVGESSDPQGGYSPFVFDLGAANPAMIDLGDWGEAWAVDGAIVVGEAGMQPRGHHAFAVDLATATPTVKDLGTLGTQSSAYAVDGNTLAGYTETIPDWLRDSNWHAFAYDLGAQTPAMIDLGTLGGPSSEAGAVSGDLVVGAAATAEYTSHATAWPLHYTTAPALAFTTLKQEVQENAGTVTLTVTRAGDPTVPGTVGYTTKAVVQSPLWEDPPYIGAQAGSDFTATTGTLSFAPGETRKQFTVKIINDAQDEVNEFFLVDLRDPTGGAILTTPSTTEALIAASDQQPDASVSNSLRHPPTLGRGIFNSTAKGQTLVKPAHRRQTRRFFVHVWNSSGPLDVTAWLHGSASPPGSTVRYYHKNTDITAAMRSPQGLHVRHLTNWHSYGLRVQITIHPRAAIGARIPATVTATWHGDSTRSDTVKGVVRVLRH